MKKKAHRKPVTDDFIKSLQLKDILGTLTKDELKILQSRGIPSFTEGNMPLKGLEISTGKDKIGLKRWLKMVQ